MGEKRKLTPKNRKLEPKKQHKKIDPRAMLLNEKLSSELEKEGVRLFRPVEKEGTLNINEDYLTLPANITEVPAHIIGEYLNAFTQQKLYMRTLFCDLGCIVEEYRRDYETACISKYTELSQRKLSETAKEKLLNNDEDIRPHYEALIEARLKWSMVERNIENIADAIFLISREIARRDSDFKNENRNINVGRNT